MNSQREEGKARERTYSVTCIPITANQRTTCMHRDRAMKQHNETNRNKKNQTVPLPHRHHTSFQVPPPWQVTGKENTTPAGTLYALFPSLTTPMLTNSPGAVPRSQSRMWWHVAVAAEAADDNPRNCIPSKHTNRFTVADRE